MKICFIVYSIFDLGGVQRVTSVISSELAKNHDVEILCLNNKYPINRNLYKLSENIKVDINNSLMKKNLFTKIICKSLKVLNKKTGILNNKFMSKIATNAYFPKNVQKNFIKYINDKSYDVVISVAGENSLLLGAISDEIKAKTIGWQHNSFDAYLKTKNKYFWNQDYLFKKLLKKLDATIVLTNYDKKKYKDELNIQSIVMLNPLSFESEKKSKCENKTIIYAGRLVEKQKGLDLLIDAFKIINSMDKECKLKIVGDGPDKEKIRNMISKNNLEDYVEIVEFTENIVEQYLESSLFVSSSRWEGFGLVITEAMECGLPVVSFDNSGPREIISENGKNGILVYNHDTYKLAEEIVNLLNNENRIKEMSINVSKRAKDFNIKIIVQEWNNLLLKLAN